MKYSNGRKAKSIKPHAAGYTNQAAILDFLSLHSSRKKSAYSIPSYKSPLSVHFFRVCAASKKDLACSRAFQALSGVERKMLERAKKKPSLVFSLLAPALFARPPPPPPPPHYLRAWNRLKKNKRL